MTQSKSKLVKSLEDVSGVRPVKSIQFGIFDPELIKRGSVVEVTVGEAYSNDEPVANGVFDSRMGVTDVGRECTTCFQQLDLCPGHFGHIQLALPVFFHHFVPNIVEVLRCVCFRCSNILIDKSDPIIMENLRKFTPDKRIKYLKGLCDKITKCRSENCSMPKPKFYNLSNKAGKKDAKSIVSIFAEFSPDVVKDKNVDPTISITALTCYMIMKKISDEDIELLGFSPAFARPEWMICTVIPVPPPAVRPSVRSGNQQMSDDLTYSLITIVKTNAKLKEKIESGDRKQVDGFHAALQHSFSMYQNNDKSVGPLVTHRSGRPLKGISQRWKEKTGRMRGNLMGKRLNKTARTVADVGVNISIDEFGVPIEIAMNLTYPEIVTPYNIDRLYTHVRNGPNKYPGAKYVIKYEGNCYGEQVPCKLTLNVLDLSKVELKPGDVVHRHLLNGDYGLFNRQPTLHRMSMMAHRIRITNEKTFKLNVFVTEPYNADFDGDELNMHVPQSIRSTVELKNIASVTQQIISPAQCRPIIKIKQDSVAGAYLMTDPDTLIEEGEFMNLMITNSEFTGKLPAPARIIDGVPYWTGHQLFSTILPDITIDVGNDQKETVKVVAGQITEGRVDSKVLDRLIHPIHNLFNPDVTKYFLDNAQNLLTKWMINCGFSISFGESLPPRGLLAEIDKLVDAGMERVNEKIRLSQQGLFYPELTDDLRYEVFEAEMIKLLGEISNEVSKIVKDYLSAHPENAYYQSIVSGAKGKWDNAMQVMGVIGQQEIWKKRVQNSFTNRSEPHFTKYDQGPYARGYCRNSFMRGMTPQEFFFHMMGGRVGLIDTAINTALVGYITRRMIKSMEDLSVKYDATVRNANGKIVCFKYGGDGFDPIKLEADSVNLLQYDDATMAKYYRFDQKDKKDWLQVITKKTVTEMFAKSADTAQLHAKLDAEFAQLSQDREQLRTKFFPNRDNALTVPDVFMPFKIGRIVKHVMGLFGLNGSQISDLNPVYVVDRVTNLIAQMVAYMQEKDTALTLVKIQIRSQLSAKQCITNYKLTRECFDYLIETLKNKAYEAFIAPGEMVGCIAAQSAGEPVLQMVLNSFAYTEKMLVSIGDKIKTVQIGEFIDELMTSSTGNPADLLLDDGVTYYLPVQEKQDIKVMSVDEDGRVAWRRVEAATRHPVVNEDGSNTLLRVTTRSGRTVIATKAKSFLTWDGSKIVPIRGDELRIGTRVPITYRASWGDLIDKQIDGKDLVDVVNQKTPDDAFIYATLLTQSRTGVFTVFDAATGKITVKPLDENDETHGDVVMDPVIEITEVEYTRPWVYDFTVEDTRNFMMLNLMNCRDTFHFSGLGTRSTSVTQGAPRIEEIIIATKAMKTPSAMIFLKEEYRYDQDKAEELRAALEYTQLSDLVLKTEIIYEHENAVLNNDEDLAFVQLTSEFNEILGLDQGSEYSPSILRIEFDREAMLYKNMTMTEIQENILRTGSLEEYIHSTVSDDNSQNLVMRLRIKENDGTESRIDFIEELKKELLKVKLRGVPGIKTVGRTEQTIVVYTPDGKPEARKEQILITTGTNLAEILTYDIVDIERTTSNDIHEILALFGIKATRQKIYEELKAVYGGAGIELNARHMQLIADNMTYSGRLLPMSRYGVPNRSEDSGVVARMSNEELLDSLIRGARFHDIDNMKGTSVNVMMGQMVPAGTTAFDLILDEPLFMANIGKNKDQEQRRVVSTYTDVKALNTKIDTLYKGEDATYDVLDSDFEENLVEPDAQPATKIEPQIDLRITGSSGEKSSTPRAKRVKKI